MFFVKKKKPSVQKSEPVQVKLHVCHEYREKPDRFSHLNFRSWCVSTTQSNKIFFTIVALAYLANFTLEYLNTIGKFSVMYLN